MIMRAAIYARFSTDLQRDASIVDQLRNCRAHAERSGWNVVETYSDRAISGASLLRPGFQKLLDDARGGRFDVVVAEALDRLSRDQEHIAGFYKQLVFAGIKLVTLSEGEINELHVGLKGTMNALFLKDLAIKTHRGIEGRVREGRIGGGLCFGYDVVRTLRADGEIDRGLRSVNEAEAKIVVQIFEAFAAGESPRGLASRLNANGVKGPGGRAWCDTTIRGHGKRGSGILRNQLYAGRLVWNKQRYVKDPASGRRRARVNPPDRWITVEAPDLKIVGAKLWAKVETRLAAIDASPMVVKSKAKKAFWEHRRAKHLFSGVTVCGVCDGLIVTVGGKSLGCSNARRKGTCTNRRTLPRAQIEAPILETLRDNLLSADLVAEFERAYREDMNRLARDRFELDANLEQELSGVRRQLDGLITAIADGLRAPDLQTRLDMLGAKRTELEAKLAAKAPNVPRLHPNTAELYRRKVGELQGLLEDAELRIEAAEAIRGLVTRIVVTPTAEGCEIVLEGDIVRMVKLAAGADVPRELLRSVKVGAGIGFEPMTFRL